MAIDKNPKRWLSPSQEAFISGGAQRTSTSRLPVGRLKKDPIMIRIDKDLLGRIDSAAKKLGISRSAFIVSSAAGQLEQMEN